MAADKKRIIELELKKCMEELERVGGVSLGKILEHGTGPTPAYFVDGDGDIPDLNALNRIQSCLSGNIYDVPSDIPNAQFFSEEIDAKHNFRKTKLVVHTTQNRECKPKVCSISVFQEVKGQWKFLSYLFTTNDPLACDNFNCFRGVSSFDDKPALHCVEQKVFCEAKVRVALSFLKSKTPEELVEFIRSNFVKYQLIATLLDDTRLKDQIKDIEQSSAASNVRSEACLAAAREALEMVSASQFYDSYKKFLESKLQLSIYLPPGKNYKAVGQQVILDKQHLEAWDKIAMVCALSERMHLLSISGHERRLMAALIPECVIECSEDDFKWACRLPSNHQMSALKDGLGFEYMMLMVEYQAFYQKTFIDKFKAAQRDGDYDQMMAMLFNPSNVQLLGLSEKIIQSLWKGEIEFDDTLQQKIADKLGTYGITFHFSLCDLRASRHTALQVANAIGIRA